MPALVLLAASAAVVSRSSVEAAPQRALDAMLGDELFTAYAARGESVLVPALPGSSVRLERFRTDFERRVYPAWRRGPRQPLQAVFLLDVALVRSTRYGVDDTLSVFFTMGADLLQSRSDPPGANPAADAFELAWYRTVVAFFSRMHRPLLFRRLAIDPIGTRVAATAAPAGVPPVLVDPWIDIARGFAVESFVIENPQTIDPLGREAIAYYDKAATHAPTRAEATLRGAWLRMQLGDAADAVTLLETFQDNWTTDVDLRYVRHVLLARANDTLGRTDAAVAAYKDALAIVPSAQSPRVGLMAIAARRGDRQEAEALAIAVRTAADEVHDPWWSYNDGEGRFFDTRLAKLREMSRR